MGHKVKKGVLSVILLFVLVQNILAQMSEIPKSEDIIFFESLVQKIAQIRKFHLQEAILNDINNGEAYSIAVTSDGGIVVGGWDEVSPGNYDIKIFKFDWDFNKIWEFRYGGSKNDAIFKLRELKNGNIVAVGYTYSNSSGKSDILVLMLTSSGELVWDFKYGGKERDEAYDFIESSDGNILVTGWTKSFGYGGFDIFLLSITKYGTKSFFETFGYQGDDAALSICETSDSNFLIAGYTSSFVNKKKEVYVLKVSGDGTLLWSKTLGGNEDDEAYCVKAVGNGDYIIAGRTFYSSSWDVYLVKIDETGKMEWEKKFGGVNDDNGYCVVVDIDGGFVVAGSTKSFGYGNSDVYLLKTDRNGNLLWQTNFGGENLDSCYQITLVNDRFYLIAGWSKRVKKRSYFYIIETSREFCAQRGIVN